MLWLVLSAVGAGVALLLWGRKLADFIKLAYLVGERMETDDREDD